jgi:hypothetical protein
MPDNSLTPQLSWPNPVEKRPALKEKFWSLCRLPSRLEKSARKALEHLRKERVKSALEYY